MSEIEAINSVLARIGCDEMLIGGKQPFSFLFVSTVCFLMIMCMIGDVILLSPKG